jgi:ethanolamine utilization protein
MDLDKLINEVTNVVLERLQKEEHTKERFVILSETENKDIESALGDIASLEYYKDIKQLEDCDGIICPYICHIGIANIAMGTASDHIQAAYLQAALSGLKLYQLKDGVGYHRYKNTMPPGLLSLYQEYENTLRSYGVKFVTLQELRYDIKSSDKKCKSENITPSGACDDTIPRKLITEKLIKSLYESGSRELNIRKKDIITSLAEDFIRDNHISVKRE